MVSNLNGTFQSALILFYLSIRTFPSILWWLLYSSLLFRFPNPPPHCSVISYFPKKIGDKIIEMPQTPVISPMHVLEFHKHNTLCPSMEDSTAPPTMALPSPVFCLVPLQGSCSIRRCSNHPMFQISFFINSLLSTFKILTLLLFSRNFFIPYIPLNISPFHFLFSFHETSEKSCLNLLSLIPHLPVAHLFIAIYIWSSLF